MLIRKWRTCLFKINKKVEKIGEKRERRAINKGSLWRLFCRGGVTQNPREEEIYFYTFFCSLFFNSRPRDLFTK